VRLRAKGYEPFFDRSSIPPGALFDNHIERAIKKSDLFVFFISPGSTTRGAYALTELQRARERWPNPEGQVLPVMAVATEPKDIDPYLRQINLHVPSGNFAADVCGEIARMLPASQDGGSATSLSELLATLEPSPRLRALIGRDLEGHIAIDDGLLFERAPMPEGWRHDQIQWAYDPAPVMSPELEAIADRHRSKLSPPNKIKLSVRSIKASLLDQTSGRFELELALSPITYYQIRGLENALDEQQPGAWSLRERYFRAHALPSGEASAPRRLPNKAVVHVLVVSRDDKFLIMRRSSGVEFQSNHWSASFEEQVQGDYHDENSGRMEPADASLGAAAARGLEEELGIRIGADRVIFLGVCSEYENLAYDFVAAVKLDLDAADIHTQWKLFAKDKKEHDRLLALPFERRYVHDLLRQGRIYSPEHGVEGAPWHPTSRIRILLGALHFGVLK